MEEVVELSLEAIDPDHVGCTNGSDQLKSHKSSQGDQVQP